MNRLHQENGFTLLEVMIVVFILSAISAVVIGSIVIFQKKTELDNSVQEFANVIKFAQSKTASSQQESQYGVYINTAPTPDQYVLFRGANYASRVTSFDQIYPLPNTVEFSSISLGGGNEIVFEKLSGFSQQSGSIALRLIQDTSQAKTVYIANSGAIDFTLPQTPSDALRVKDSRHVHFAYSRIINTASENVVLTFDNTVVQTIPIVSNLVSGQFYWQGTVVVGGSNQTIKVQTHRLNSPDTEFSIHRDRSLNNKTLRVTISGDGSGNITNYSADGTTTTYSSIYVSNLVWQ